MSSEELSLFDVHAIWAWVMIIGNGLAGLWVLTAWKLHSLRTRALWWFVIFAQVAVLIQVLLGLSLLTIEHLEAPFFHYFYGIVATAAIMLLLVYRNRMRNHIYLLYGIGGLFVMGLGIRAMVVVVTS